MRQVLRGSEKDAELFRMAEVPTVETNEDS